MHYGALLIISDSRDGGCLWRRGVIRQKVLELLEQIRVTMEQLCDLRWTRSGEAELWHVRNMWREGAIPPRKHLGWACYACGTC
jgi:hypothetical protein